MALTNIGNEPRREITESAFGILVVAAFGWLDWIICTKIDPYYHADASTPPWGLQIAFLMLIIGLVGPLIIFISLVFTHAVGEVICGLMQDFGFDPRPKRRR